METLDDEEAEDVENNMNNDMEISELLVDEAIPFSLEYFLGIVKNDEEVGEDDEDEDDEEDDSDEEVKPTKGKKKISQDKSKKDPE
jgi:hypothetical protein